MELKKVNDENFDKILVVSFKCHSFGEKRFKEEKSIKILKIFGLIKNE